MSAVHITAVNVLDNPAPFLNPLQFEIHYECLGDLQEGVCEVKLHHMLRGCSLSPVTEPSVACRSSVEVNLRWISGVREV